METTTLAAAETVPGSDGGSPERLPPPGEGPADPRVLHEPLPAGLPQHLQEVSQEEGEQRLLRQQGAQE